LISNAGDINGDGIGDLLFGGGRALGYVVFGNTALPSSINLDTLGTAGVTIVGEPSGPSRGVAHAAGDINGDGFDDIVLGEDWHGHCFLIFGSSSLPETLELDNLGAAGVTVLAPLIADPIPPHVFVLFPSSAGDTNGDGFDDLLFMTFIKEGVAFDGITTTFVVLGKESITGVIDLSKPEAYAVKIAGAINHVGFVNRIGDINADGFDDIGLGAPTSVIFGAADLPSTIELASLGAAGIQILPDAGRLAEAGDFNGDGFVDLAVSYFNYFAVSKSYVVFGSNDFSSSVTRLGNAAPNTLTGTPAADVMVGEQGDDTLLGNGGPDVLIGGQGNDLLVARDLNFRRIVGGTGSDTLRLVGSGLTLDLTVAKFNRIEGIETIDISGSGNNTLALDYVSALKISDSTNTLVVRGNLGDRLNFASGWTQRANQVIDGETFKVFTQGKANLKVQLDIVVNQSPIIAAFAGRVTATQGGPSIILDSDATLADADSGNFATGRLETSRQL
jgi:hypothetical protein